MALVIDNYYELLALHRAVMESKFSIDLNDPAIEGSPLVATVANQIVEALTEMEVAKEGEAARLKWQEWRKMSLDRREYKIVQAKLRSNTAWKTWRFDKQVKHVKDLASPLQVSDELIGNLLGQ